VSPRLLLGVVVVLAVAVSASARASAAQPADIARQINSLSAFDYATRTMAARTIRRAPAAAILPALVAAVRGHADQSVRYRALVLLTSFNTPETAEVMRRLLTDRNDRVREVVYRWFERHPDPSLRPMLMAALEEDFAEEQFFAAARAAYWKADERSTVTARTVVATLIDRLEF